MYFEFHGSKDTEFFENKTMLSSAKCFHLKTAMAFTLQRK